MNKYGSRKFVVSLLALGAAQWALAEHLVGADNWTKVVIAVVGLYAAGNVAQKVVENAATKSGS